VEVRPTPTGLAACVLLWTLLALTFIDFDTQLLPDDITLPLLWAGSGAAASGVRRTRHVRAGLRRR
jgi:prepilin signal peptidase PulO-like enzyme (type II secretory pathway)